MNVKSRHRFTLTNYLIAFAIWISLRPTRLKKTMAWRLLAVGLVTLSGRMALADATLPTGLPPGSHYEIMFVTSGATTATSSNIQNYNNFVTYEADLSPVLNSLSATWTAVASTPTFSATSASLSNSIPIYDTKGDLLEATFPLLFTTYGFAGPEYTETGVFAYPYFFVWTGTYSPSDPGIGVIPLGTGLYATYGDTGSAGGGWLDQGPSNFASAHLYAISSPITAPTPEPAPFTLLGSALPGLGVVYLRRRGTRRS